MNTHNERRGVVQFIVTQPLIFSGALLHVNQAMVTSYFMIDILFEYLV